MKHVRELFEKFQSMDGRIKIGTLSGVTAVAAVIGLIVGVLPVVASTNPADPQHSTLGIHPVVVSYGGGSGACASSLDGRGPSAAGKEFHINNPMPGVTYPGPTGSGLTVTVSPAGDRFSFNISGGMVVYDVVVNGGPKNTHYDYDDHPDLDGDPAQGATTSDGKLHAPSKGNGFHNLSHINVCYDEPGKTILVCDSEAVIGDGTGTFPEAKALVLKVKDEFGNPVEPCLKDAIFRINTDNVELDFGDGDGTVTGRLDIFKDFGNTSYEDLEYDGGPSTTPPEDVPWCGFDTLTTADSTHDFVDVLEDDEYPKLPASPIGHTACKVFEGENAAGIQWNVIYFEFMDPRFY